MTHQSPAGEPLLELYDAIAQRQLRDAGAEVAAAIAHAVGTPLNVISGRAELIRHDPSNALTQVARIEEQVKKLATGLRQLVDYLAVPDPRAPQQSASVASASSAKGPGIKEGAARHGARAAASASAASASAASASAAVPDLIVVDAASVLEDVAALTEALARASHVEVVVDGSGLAGARVERWHALGTLGTLVSQAIRHCSKQASGSHVDGRVEGSPAPEAAQATNGHGAPARVRVGGGVASQGVVFELVVPGLSLVEGWQLEHFQARPAATAGSEFYRTMSICAAVVRGHGGKLLIESAPNAPAVVIRFSCINETA
jgi:signal transduction histidine kinase